MTLLAVEARPSFVFLKNLYDYSLEPLESRNVRYAFGCVVGKM